MTLITGSDCLAFRLRRKNSNTDSIQRMRLRTDKQMSKQVQASTTRETTTGEKALAGETKQTQGQIYTFSSSRNQRSRVCGDGVGAEEGEDERMAENRHQEKKDRHRCGDCNRKSGRNNGSTALCVRVRRSDDCPSDDSLIHSHTLTSCERHQELVSLFPSVFCLLIVYLGGDAPPWVGRRPFTPLMNRGKRSRTRKERL